MQSQMTVVRINEFSKFLAEGPDEKTHAIIVDDPLNPNKPLIILLVLKGGYLLYSNPRTSEYEDKSIPHIYMTSEAPVWEPSEEGFVEQEEAMTELRV